MIKYYNFNDNNIINSNMSIITIDINIKINIKFKLNDIVIKQSKK